MTATRTERHFRPHRGAVRRYWEAQAQRSSVTSRLLGGKAARPRHPGARHRQARGRGANMKLKRLDPKLGRRLAARAGGDRRQARRAFPAGRLQTGLRHAVQHERQRGDLEPGDRDAGRRHGLQEAVHPNDPVNMSQSSNDTYPTAMHIACAEQISHELIPALKHLHKALAKKAKAGTDHQDRPHPHPGRDAGTLGQEFSGYAQQVENGIARHRVDMPDADATRPGRHPPSAPASTRRSASPRRWRSGSPRSRSCLHLGAQQVRGAGAHDAMVMSHGAINTVAASLFKIATTSASSARVRAPASASCRCPRTSRAPRSCRAR